MDKQRQNMWVTVAILQIIGDMFTTWYASKTPNVFELNPMWKPFFEMETLIGMLIVKSSIVLILYMVDSFIANNYGNWAFPIIPIYLIIGGSYATLNNLLVLYSNRTDIIGLSIIMSIVTFAFVDYLVRDTNYSLTDN